MDSGGGDRRLKEIELSKNDNAEYADEPMEENISKILSPELRYVFPIFVNMLDIKSFMKLAMTSKEMYRRCMEDNMIEVNANVEKLEVNAPFDALHLRNLPCKVNVGKVEIRNYLEVSQVTAFHDHMKEIGVKKIKWFDIRCRNAEWEAIIAMIKDFDVKIMNICIPLGIDILRSFLQLNLDQLWYIDPVPVSFILELESSVREIAFIGGVRLTLEDLMRIISKIQSGSLLQLTLHRNDVNWSQLEFVPLDHDGPLPVRRPLLLGKHRSPSTRFDLREYWFLDSYGGVTKWITGGASCLTLEMFKCEPRDCPWFLRKEEDVLKDLSEKRPKVSCSANQFHTFFTSLALIPHFRNCPLPEHRPLCHKVSEYRFWLLDEKENLMNCTWENGVATWKSFNLLDHSYKELEHSSLAQLVFWKLLEKMNLDNQGNLYCEGLEELDRWFDGIQKLDFGYLGPLPNTRPLIFSKSDRFHVLLLKNRLIECNFFSNRVFVQQCTYFNRPPILFNEEGVVDMLMDPYHREDRNFNISLEEFRKGVEQFRRRSSANRHVIWEQETDSDGYFKEEYWYKIDRLVRKVIWKEGRVIVKEENDLRDSPPNFMKQVFRFFVENEAKKCSTYIFFESLTLEQFRSCLEQFIVVPFDYSAPLTRNHPLAFVKKEIRHSCSDPVACDCSDTFILVWFLWKGNRVTNCAWGKRKPMEVVFNVSMNEIPPALGKIGLRMDGF